MHSIPAIAKDTVDFGINPLWRESDTTIILHLNSRDTITAMQLSDSDWSLMTPTPIIPKNDSTITLSLAYQPPSDSNHASYLILQSISDTAAMVLLIGETSPFERRVGDSYVFTDDSGRLDSVWISSLPFSLSDSGSWSTLLFRPSALAAHDDWWILFPGPYQTRLPTASGVPFDSGFVSADPNNYYHSSASVIGDSEVFLNKVELSTNIIEASGNYEFKNRPIFMNGDGKFRICYARGIGFITNINEYDRDVNLLNYDEHISIVSAHLLSFHLRR